jgi:hypothetical protein
MIIGWPALYQHINDKKALAQYMQQKQESFSNGGFDVHPKTFSLKPGAGAAQIVNLRNKGRLTGPFIFKPTSSGQGKGLTIVRDITQPIADETLKQQLESSRVTMVMQEFLDRPFTVKGYRYNARIYAVITSLRPLRLYLHPSGLVKFAYAAQGTGKKGAADVMLGDPSEQKAQYGNGLKAAQFTTAKEKAFVAKHTKRGDILFHENRWNLRALRGFIELMGFDYGKLWAEVEDAVVKVVLSVIEQVPASSACEGSDGQCVAILGMDVDLQEVPDDRGKGTKLRPYILECNVNPR